MSKKRQGLKDSRVHIVRPSNIENEPPEKTRCGKKLSTLFECCVNSVEAATCPLCIRDEQRRHRPGARR